MSSRAGYFKQRRETLKSLGLCISCRKPAASGSPHCDSHRYKPKGTAKNFGQYAAIVAARYPTEGTSKLPSELGITVSQLRRLACRLGVKTDKTLAIERFAEAVANGNDRVDQAFFDEWSDTMAYVFGFLWADGSMRFANGRPQYITFSCAKQDEAILVAIRSAMKARHRIYHQDYEYSQQRAMCVTGRRMLERLWALGLRPRKSKTDEPFPSAVPDEFLPGFVRGVFDGDGSASGKSVWFSGTGRFIVELQRRICASVGVPMHKVHKSGKTSILAWRAAGDVLKLARWMYGPAGICLERKRRLLLGH